MARKRHSDEDCLKLLREIELQLLRMPVGEWLLLDAVTHMAGIGNATAECTFADRDGVYARGFQTIFVAPGAQSTNLPRHAADRK